MKPDEITRIVSSAQHKQPKINPPKGWEPRLDVEEGVICYTSAQTVDNHDWESLVTYFGFDPALFTVDPATLRASAWEQRTTDGETTVLHAYKAAIRVKTAQIDVSTCIHAHLRQVKAKPNPTEYPKSGLVFGVSDSQVGKKDAYGAGLPTQDGIEQMMERFAAIPTVLDKRWKEAKARGADAITILSPGDIVEGCFGNYGNQQYMTGLNKLEQREFATDGLELLIRKAASYGVPVQVAAVGGNHGEVRHGGSISTDFADNDDIGVYRVIERAYALSGKYPNVQFLLPHHELHQTIEVAGTYIGLVHGHNFAGRDGAWKWWDQMGRNRDPIGQAHILATGHFHHLRIEQPTQDRTWMQFPAMEAGSHWWFNKAGGRFTTGHVLSFITSNGSWTNLNQDEL